METRNLKRNRRFQKEAQPPGAKNADGIRTHSSRGGGGQMHRRARRGPSRRGHSHPEVSLIFCPVGELEDQAPTQGWGRPQPTQGCQGPSLGRQLQLFGLQVLLSADKLFPNSQPGVRKHLMSLARLGLAPRPGDGRGWRSRFAGCHLDESEESLSHSRRGGI